MKTPIPAEAKDIVVLDAAADVEKIAGMVDFVFCAVDMKKDEIRALEERYAKAECPVVSNNSAHRWTDDVPMVVPEMNPQHLEVIASQRQRLGTKRGFIAVKSNCSIQSYAQMCIRDSFWLATVQEVLQADWQEVWHSPQPPWAALFFKVAPFRVWMCFIGIFLPNMLS